MRIRKFKKQLFDAAYGSFLFCGLVSTLIGLASYVPMDTGTAGAIGLIILIPLSIVGIGAMILGLILSFLLRSHNPLVVLSILSIAFIIEVVSEAGSPSFYNSVILIYGVLAIGIPSWWFIVKRKDFW